MKNTTQARLVAELGGIALLAVFTGLLMAFFAGYGIVLIFVLLLGSAGWYLYKTGLSGVMKLLESKQESVEPEHNAAPQQTEELDLASLSMPTEGENNWSAIYEAA